MQPIMNYTDGQMEYDDKGIRVYWDAVLKDWVDSPKWATERFLKLLFSLDTFEGFDDDSDSDSDSDDV
jgi:hypothetical protein